MSDFPILTVIVFTPAVGAFLVLCTPARRPELARALGYVTTVATLGLTGWLLWHFQRGEAGFQFVEQYRWIDDIGVDYLFGVDGLSLFMVVITAFLFPIGLLASQPLQHRVKAYVFWFLLLEMSIMGIFASLDLICFFVFWEFLLVPMYFLIAGWGSGRRVYAAVKFFIFTAAGSAFLLVSILVLGFLHQSATGDLTFDFRTLMDWDGLSLTTERWLFLGFMISFAIKAPLVPFHTWLPDVHTEAPTFGSVILAGVLLKMGAYGFLRFSFTLFPQASIDFAPLMLTLAVIGIVYGAVVAAMQTDIKRLIAYSSVSHMGFIVLGIFSLTTIGLDGALFIMLSHPLTTGALFLLVGMLYERRHTRMIADLSGIWKVMPIFTGMFLVATFAGIGLPGLSGFVGEFLALLGTFAGDGVWAVIATTGVILAAVYMLWAVQRVFTGTPSAENAGLRDVGVREVLVVAPLLVASLFLGIYPKPVLDRVEPTAKSLIDHFERETDFREDSPNPLIEAETGTSDSPRGDTASERTEPAEDDEDGERTGGRAGAASEAKRR
jgi:NADH-quinone oxidoreductase subunit M